ncbi:MAG: hypothetical protein KJ731_01905 [Alphaproteobacteria bacterium]|nr:hypothetical protein [Alphaproteobacteria bacterium]MBU1280593.1 hypothetical protein [Alphaproteobacteria bacterium]MBU1574480.1 hypothetical protein [Alphaproteobacteria bacterium]MBU1827223.1 hypothetical protein [Alphaproteobacteria bacterium]MBU2078833.1 hypothetical protein [Alphaproteobacteria bacterium]
MTNTNDPFKTNGQNTYQGSVNQGKSEAEKGYTPSPQQPGESYVSYQTRMNSYNSNK